MKIQFVSDLHLELADNIRYLQQHPLPVTGDVLLLAGDTIYLEQEHLMKHPFWQWASENYKQVIAVPGNHEYYAYYDLASVAPSRRWELFPNVHICSNTVEHLSEDIDVICSTLWAHIDLQNAYYTEQYVSDFHRIPPCCCLRTRQMSMMLLSLNTSSSPVSAAMKTPALSPPNSMSKRPMLRSRRLPNWFPNFNLRVWLRGRVCRRPAPSCRHDTVCGG